MTTAYRLHIRPNSGWLRLDLHALWEYRDLLAIMVRRDFVAKYKQTLLGPAWFVVQPLITTLVFVVIFGGVAKIPSGDSPHLLFYLSGWLGWNYFAQNFASTSSVFVNNANLFGKVYFPRLIPPLAAVLSNLFNVAVQIGMILVSYVVYKCIPSRAVTFGMHWEIVFLPLIILHIAAVSLGVGLWMSALTVTYRDFSHLSAFLMQLWMYASPVVYPLMLISQKWRWVFLLNPMTMPIEATRYVFLGVGLVNATYQEVSIGMTLALLVSGLILFQHVERTFIDTV
jgi:lipopolysaccharide transport system permease protein